MNIEKVPEASPGPFATHGWVQINLWTAGVVDMWVFIKKAAWIHEKLNTACWYPCGQLWSMRIPYFRRWINSFAISNYAQGGKVGISISKVILVT